MAQAQSALRQPARPAWESDLTERLMLHSGNPSAPADAVAKPLTFAQATSRARRAQLLAKPDQTFWWSVPVARPANAENWPLVAEWDESRLVTEVAFDGQKLPRPNRAAALQWHGGEGSVLLPLSAEKPQGTLSFRAGWLTQLYDNGFGRLRLRPATLDEVLTLVRDTDNNSVRAINRGPLPLNLQLSFRAEDFFGAPLGEAKQNLTLAPVASQNIPLPDALQNAGGELYKTRIQASVPNQAPLEFWILRDRLRENRARPEVLRLESGWQWAPAAKDHAGAVPDNDFRPVEKLPFSVPGTAWTTHWFWLKNTIKVPENWGARRVQLWLLGANHHVKIFVNGQPVGERAFWELPGRIALPDSVKAGGTYEIRLALTDYIVGLAPGVAIPAGGKSDLPGRGLAAPIDNNAAPALWGAELLGVPAVRCDSAVVRTKVVGAFQAQALLEIRNDGAAPQSVNISATILDAGKALATLQINNVNIAPGAVESAAPIIALADVQAWSPENPKLYELRIELRDAAGTILDVRRERFGFREWGIAGDHFTLNGERINLWGGSHHYFDENSVWPVRGHFNRFVRWYYPGANSFMAGRSGLNLMDDLGMPVKVETPQNNALHRDRYAFHEDITWQRMSAAMKNCAAALINNPAIAMWDVGNELWFARDGEDAKMVATYGELRRFDPTRYVTNSGGYPNMLPGAEIIDWHGWPNFQNRRDWFFFHPEERPSYEKTKGFFARRTAEGNWTILNSGLMPKDPDKLLALGNQPILFSEGHYYEEEIRPSLGGLDALVPLPEYGNSDWERGMALHALNWLASRRQTVQAARVAGFAGNIIHVDRGIGRWTQPLIAASVDRRVRFVAGGRLQTRFRVLHDLSGARNVNAQFVLFDGEKQIAGVTRQFLMQGGGYEDVNLDFPLPASAEDKEYRLHVEVWAAGYGGYFRDDLPIVAFASQPLRAAPQLAVYDPRGATVNYLKARGAQFQTLARLADWNRAAPLLIGSEALSATKPEELPPLRDKINAGGRIAILDHRTLPAFLNRRVVQAQTASGTLFVNGPSPLTRGLLTPDFRYWHTRENDWISEWGALENPATGFVRGYLQRDDYFPLAELGEGAGRVLFCQLNMQDALGFEPAADRVLQNILDWSAAGLAPPSNRQPAPTQRLEEGASPAPLREVASGILPTTQTEKTAVGATLLVVADAQKLAVLRGRFGVEGTIAAPPTAEQLQKAKLIIFDGADAALREKIDSAALKTTIENGAKLFILSPDAGAAQWLSHLSGAQIGLEDFAQNKAFLAARDDVTAGLNTYSFWMGGNANGDVDKPLPAAPDSLAHKRLTGVIALTTPAFIGKVPLGQGEIILNTTRGLEYPVRKPAFILSTLLQNCGAPLVAGGIISSSEPVARWAFAPLDLAKQMNWSLSDDPNGRRGFHMQGMEADFRIFPRGKQNFKGVEYDLVDPDKNGGNGVIALAGTVGKDVLPAEVKGIAVRRKAERLYFLHNSAWGRPGFVYRVYYTEDRKKWIPGMPDPFVDVVVNPQNNIADWWGVQAYEKGEAFLGGATVAWSGQTVGSKAHGNQFVGVFQMFWDNPHPEKEIESIDILSPGKIGSGQVFVYAITAANRLEAGAKPSLQSLAPNIKSEAVFEQWQNARYGLVVAKDGTVPVIYNAAGKPLAQINGWQMITNNQWQDGQSNKNVDLKAATQPDGARVYTIENAAARGTKWSQKIICKPAGVRVEWTFIPQEGAARPGWIPADIKILSPVQNNIERYGLNPIEVLTEGGALQIYWDKRVMTWMASYSIRGRNFQWNTIYEAPWKAGEPITFWAEIGL